MKRLFTSLPMILAMATVAALAFMFIIVDDPADKPNPAETVEH